jgi:uncharacterized membrane protein YbaN (DUF454 family)
MPATDFVVLAVIFFLRSLPGQFLFLHCLTPATGFVVLAVIFFFYVLWLVSFSFHAGFRRQRVL